MGVIFTLFATSLRLEFITEFKLTEREEKKRHRKRQTRETHKEEIEGISNKMKRYSICVEIIFKWRRYKCRNDSIG